MTVIEFYMDGKNTIDNPDVLITGGAGFATPVGKGNVRDKKVVRVLVKLRSKAFMEEALGSMMRVVMLFSISTVVFHGFQD
ncbi:hypothetical protein [Mesorhizobium sp. ES1-1]|uniref:hypothetical protein n=1 Tax=Mesorhizobium sp. ES1-1 TaxID=2876629 RepID=UPI001CCB495B|nr:hypothetical protein [Mesorhizobium sp. ES1-1]MBZ9674514.1 hypothetical protein [Mesorhizobium sp. ES1-1]